MVRSSGAASVALLFSTMFHASQGAVRNEDSVNFSHEYRYVRRLFCAGDFMIVDGGNKIIPFRSSDSSKSISSWVQDTAITAPVNGFACAIATDGVKVAVSSCDPTQHDENNIYVLTFDSGGSNDWVIDGSAAIDAPTGMEFTFGHHLSILGDSLAAYNTADKFIYVYQYVAGWPAAPTTILDTTALQEVSSTISNFEFLLQTTMLVVNSGHNSARGAVQLYSLIGGVWTTDGTMITGASVGDALGYSLSVDTATGVFAINTAVNSVSVYRKVGIAWNADANGPNLSSLSFSDKKQMRMSINGNTLVVCNPFLRLSSEDALRTGRTSGRCVIYTYDNVDTWNLSGDTIEYSTATLSRTFGESVCTTGGTTFITNAHSDLFGVNMA